LRLAVKRALARTWVDGRMFVYDRRLLPNEYLAELERKTYDLPSAGFHTGLSVGYPAWNLVYYTLLCSLPPEGTTPVVVETGTNRGFSTIVLAQALKDGDRGGIVRTVDINPSVVETARESVALAGLSSYVEFNVGDSVDYLRRLVPTLDRLDLVFLDGSHERKVVCEEFSIVHPLVTGVGGKVVFDNTTFGGVAEALGQIRDEYGGSLVEFENCSWYPPGCVIWQADRARPYPQQNGR
jgi:predicted O-methyltransferase YrrM